MNSRKVLRMTKSSRNRVRTSPFMYGLSLLLDRFFVVAMALGLVAMFTAAFMFAWLKIDTTNQQMTRGDLVNQHRQLTAEIETLNRKVNRYQRHAALEAKATLAGFHKPERSEMIRVVSPDKLSADQRTSTQSSN